MRRKLIRALSYPRFLMRDYLELDDCDFHGTFDPACPQCRVCSQEPECQWLINHDEFAALENKAVVDLVRALETALMYVDARVAFWDHNRRVCVCDACRWLRTTRHLLREATEAPDASGDADA